MSKQGEKLIYRRPDGTEEPCTMMFKGWCARVRGGAV